MKRALPWRSHLQRQLLWQQFESQLLRRIHPVIILFSAIAAHARYLFNCCPTACSDNVVFPPQQP